MANQVRRPRYRRLEAKRFLVAFHDDFVRGSDGRSWPRWRSTVKAAHRYAEGLLSLPEGSRKNMQRLAKSVGVPEDRLEQFVRDSPWDHEILQAHLARAVPKKVRHASAGLIVDDFGIEKQGKHSVGTQRQYSGTLGKTGNCQVAVNLVYVSPGKKRNADQKTWPLGTKLYLPESWTNDKARRKEAHVPRDVRFRTKPEIALEMIAQARVVEHAFVGADADYGRTNDFRAQLRAWREPYVVAVTPAHVLVAPASAPIVAPSPWGKHSTFPEEVGVESVDERFGRASWKRIEWSQGTKGTLGGWFCRERVRVAGPKTQTDGPHHATDEVCWLLLEKRKNEKGQEEFKAYLCWGMDAASLEDLVAKAHLRWAIEQFHKEAKQLLGLDRFEGRTWPGWHHHASMVLLAYAFLSLLRIQEPRQPLPSLATAARAVQWEIATQGLIQDHALTRENARTYAASVLQRVSTWFKPRE